MSDRDEINSRPRRASEAHRKRHENANNTHLFRSEPNTGVQNLEIGQNWVFPAYFLSHLLAELHLKPQTGDPKGFE
jgi:hypothetical protein